MLNPPLLVEVGIPESPLVRGRIHRGSFDFFSYAIPLSRPYRWAKGLQHVRYGALVRFAAGDVEGWGEVAPPPHEAFGKSELELALLQLPPVLPDDDTITTVLDGVSPRLRCGIVSAWLNAQASKRGESLADCLGLMVGRKPASRIPVNALVTAATQEEAQTEADEYIAAGFGTLKVKCGADIELDLERVAAIREVSSNVIIRLDANEAWPEGEILRILHRFAPLNIEYIEQPVPAHLGVPFFAELRRNSPIPIALDELAGDVATLRAVVDAGAADAIILKTQRLGGPDRMVEAIRLLETAGMKTVVTSSLESAIGTRVGLSLAAILRTPLPACGFGISGYLAQDFAASPAVKNGWAELI